MMLYGYILIIVVDANSTIFLGASPIALGILLQPAVASKVLKAAQHCAAED